MAVRALALVGAVLLSGCAGSLSGGDLPRDVRALMAEQGDLPSGWGLARTPYSDDMPWVADPGMTSNPGRVPDANITEVAGWGPTEAYAQVWRGPRDEFAQRLEVLVVRFADATAADAWLDGAGCTTLRLGALAVRISGGPTEAGIFVADGRDEAVERIVKGIASRSGATVRCPGTDGLARFEPLLQNAGVTVHGHDPWSDRGAATVEPASQERLAETGAVAGRVAEYRGSDVHRIAALRFADAGGARAFAAAHCLQREATVWANDTALLLEGAGARWSTAPFARATGMQPCLAVATTPEEPNDAMPLARRLVLDDAGHHDLRTAEHGLNGTDEDWYVFEATGPLARVDLEKDLGFSAGEFGFQSVPVEVALFDGNGSRLEEPWRASPDDRYAPARGTTYVHVKAPALQGEARYGLRVLSACDENGKCV